MPVICRLPQKSSGSAVLTGTAIESDVASGKTFYNTDSNTKLTGTASGGGMVLPVGTNCRPTGDVTIPSGVTSLYQYVFCYNTAVTSVIMSNTITFCDTDVFNGCTNLVSISLSENLMGLSDNMFVGCIKLVSITIPNKVKRIGAQALCNCTSLKNLVIPNTIITYYGNAFSGCSNLEFITLGNGFNCSISISASTKYSRDTLMAMINAYANASGKTLTMGATNLAKLSTEDKAVASNKGLTLA